MISKSTIDKIFSTIRVEEIIGEYVQLKRAGSNYKGLSPFHDEKSPSFIVSPSKQIWKDFSSGKGGTAISFLMEIENFTYPEALRHAAKKYGIEIEEDVKEYSEEAKQAQSERDLLYKIHEVANDYYQDQIWESEEGRMIGYSYFKERELKDEIIKKFQLGYSPEKKDAFTAFALEKGYAKEILEKSGLSIFPENTPSGVDRFRERVIFPIHSFSGRVLGFGARILKNNVKTAKYLNSPETEIYHKSNVLYGLYQGKQAISKKNLCLLVEGYMDVVALHQSGIENVVASSGTSLTTEQIKLIKRLTENVTILFDGDNAGIKASFRSIDMLLTEGMNIRVLLFPDGDDPDSFSRKHPQEFVENYIDKEAKDFIEFKAEVLLKEAADDPIKKAEAVRNIVKSVGFVQNALKREIFLKEISTKFGLSEQSLSNELSIVKQVEDKRYSPENKDIFTQNTELKLEEKVPFSKIDLELLLQEEFLFTYILKYGNYIMTHSVNGVESKITVTEKIIYALQEDNCTILSPVNDIVYKTILNGLDDNELRSGQYFFDIEDRELSVKLASSLIEKYTTSDWGRFNIYFKTPEDVFEALVNDNILRYKLAYIGKVVEDLKIEYEGMANKDEMYQKILNLQILRLQINEKLNKIL